MAIQKEVLVGHARERVYELEDTGVRLKPITRRVFWCDATSEVYRRVRVADNS